MILVKCTNENCNFALNEEQVAALIKEKKPVRQKKCPTCKKAKLKFNVTEPLDRKKWHAYLNRDKSIIEHMVLVITDNYSDGSHEVEVPLINLHLNMGDMMQATNKALSAIDEYLERKYGVTCGMERRFVTVAFQGEIEPAKRNIPIGEVIFKDLFSPP